ncbi:DUF58 domain-containing protein [Lipingzhangella sp. LS1_29]|uniref:DUF58 domain-containing protein n=1 Tax=Lipingzhangella rawalii TaxID=2055835 RepID=A0ABU2H541_9ACTN|nr:DUF58 domain-containing protein [Lipingzhangella rawalii]MDS1270413.1 DUF58 domain-containing protein [Lipingzhangella rawalii]
MILTGRATLLALGCVPLAWAAAGWGWGVVLVLTAALVAVVIVDLGLAASPRSLGFARSGETSVRLGDSVTTEVQVTNPGARTLRARVRDAWPPSSNPQPRAHRLHIPPGDRRRMATELTPNRRGDHHPHGVTVRSYGPLGLAARQCTHQVPGSLRALPPFHSRRHLPGKLARLRELDGQQRALIRGQGSEFDSLREYVPGDDVRSIDWRATARSSSIVVRTWRPERNRRILLVLDTSRTSAGRVGDTPRLDHSMDAALLLAALASRAGDHTGLLAYDRHPRARVSSRGRSMSMSTLVQAMAPLEPALVESDAQGLVSTILGGRDQGRQLVVLLTDLNAAAMEEGLLPLLPALTSRHLVLVASVADPAVAEMATGRGDARAVYSAAAAERTRVQRRRVTAELRRHGVEVVDADPEHLAPALADAYIALKAAGRL